MPKYLCLAALLSITSATARNFTCSAVRGAESVSIAGAYSNAGNAYRVRGRLAIEVRDEFGRRITGRRGPRIAFNAWRVNVSSVNDLLTVALNTQNHGHGDMLILQHRIKDAGHDVIDLSLARGDGSEIYARNYRDVSCRFK